MLREGAGGFYWRQDVILVDSKLRALLIGALVLALGACATTEQAAPPPVEEPVVETPEDNRPDYSQYHPMEGITTEERIRQALALLEQGKPLRIEQLDIFRLDFQATLVNLDRTLVITGALISHSST